MRGGRARAHAGETLVARVAPRAVVRALRPLRPATVAVRPPSCPVALVPGRLGQSFRPRFRFGRVRDGRRRDQRRGTRRCGADIRGYPWERRFINLLSIILILNKPTYRQPIVTSYRYDYHMSNKFYTLFHMFKRFFFLNYRLVISLFLFLFL